MRFSDPPSAVEGEGYFAGQPTSFIRFGYCDSRCDWCDSLHAVLPEKVKENATWMTANEIADRILALCPTKRHLITFSGGNPALWDLDELACNLEDRGMLVKVETQGTVFRPWLNGVHHVVISPKPPSAQPRAGDFDRFVAFKKRLHTAHSLKVVVFDQKDLDFAMQVGQVDPRRTLYLSCGTYADDTRDDLGERYAWLCEAAVKTYPKYGLQDIKILPQLHVFAHLHKLGV